MTEAYTLALQTATKLQRKEPYYKKICAVKRIPSISVLAINLTESRSWKIEILLGQYGICHS